MLWKYWVGPFFLDAVFFPFSLSPIGDHDRHVLVIGGYEEVECAETS